MEEIYTPGAIKAAKEEVKVEEVIPEKEPEELPVVRQQQDVKLGFTEKKFPHLPARESHLKEAPYPKSKNLD